LIFDFCIFKLTNSQFEFRQGCSLLSTPDELWMFFLFLLGASTGSFLNVLVWRLPREISIVHPGSHCVRCKHPLAWYDNLPVIGWFLLMGRCRYCGEKFSIRYPLVELLTGILFVILYWAYFVEGVRQFMPDFTNGGFLIYAGHIILICALLAGSLIDAEHWIIPLSLCYAAALCGAVLSMIWPYLLTLDPSSFWRLIPYAGPKTAALALGAALGLIIGILLLYFGVLSRSFTESIALETPPPAATGPQPGGEEGESPVAQPHSAPCDSAKSETEGEVNIRREMLRELLFLTPAIILAIVFFLFLSGKNSFTEAWQRVIIEQKWLAGLSGSLFGFMIGGGIVWFTRILGSLAFGREAMGLGDVHLMAAVGAVLGWFSATVAFFVAPFLGLGWAISRLIIHRSREIPYGPFLSLATVMVIFMHDILAAYFWNVFTADMPLP